MYISQASNFRNLSKIAKLNTCEFLELPIDMILSIKYQLFRDIICSILGNVMYTIIPDEFR